MIGETCRLTLQSYREATNDLLIFFRSVTKKALKPLGRQKSQFFTKRSGLSGNRFLLGQYAVIYVCWKSHKILEMNRKLSILVLCFGKEEKREHSFYSEGLKWPGEEVRSGRRCKLSSLSSSSLLSVQPSSASLSLAALCAEHCRGNTVYTTSLLDPPG